MSHQDQGNCGVECHADALRSAIDELLSVCSFRGIRFSDQCSWNPLTLCSAILFWCWSDESTLTERFRTARKIVMKCFHVEHELSTAYQPFMRMVVRWSGTLLPCIIDAFRNLMQEKLKDRFRIAGFAVVAADGSRFELPRTESNERFFSPRDDNGKRKRPRKGKQKNSDLQKSKSPQMWVTVLWHVGCSLPWSWKRGESGSSERGHLRDMIPQLAKNSLVAADAGFAGYEYWKAILDAGHDFVIRVGSNVKLLKKLGYAREYNNRVYLWPDTAAARHQPPLVLRLLILKGGKTPVYLVVSVLSSNGLSDRQISEIYQYRWGVEVFYRHVKQTFDRRKLRSRKPEHALLELDWSLLGLWAVCLLAQLKTPQIKPRHFSLAGILHAIRRPMREYKSFPDPEEDLGSLLSRAVTDQYDRRRKSSRNFPRKKQKRALIGIPQIQPATKIQKRQAQEIKTAAHAVTLQG